MVSVHSLDSPRHGGCRDQRPSALPWYSSTLVSKSSLYEHRRAVYLEAQHNSDTGHNIDLVQIDVAWASMCQGLPSTMILPLHLHIKQKLLGFVASQPKLIFIHAGTNNLVNGYNGGAGYNGGWGKKAALHSMADLLSVAKGQFPESRIILSGVLKRGDISNSSIYLFNEQLDLMCNNFGVVFVDANDSIKRYHLARDGRHLNRTGNHLLGNFIFSHIQEGVDVVPSAVSSVPLPLAPTSSETAALDGHPSGSPIRTEKFRDYACVSVWSTSLRISLTHALLLCSTPSSLTCSLKLMR
ncbi:hypothetical protein J6590_029077 [Homalodisca vitripennis]|nr:hypothetical protein J6590_029077 [Homalodisca vitripennis]